MTTREGILIALSAWAWMTAQEWWKLMLGGMVAIPAATAAIKGLLDLWDRFTKRRLTIERVLQDEQHGNVITIVNISDKPLPISHFDVVWFRRRWWGKGVTYEPTDMGLDDGFTIAAHDRHRIIYAEADWFSWNAAMQDRHGRLWFRIWVAGDRRVKWFPLH